MKYFTVKDGKIENGTVLKTLFSELEDGEYLLDIKNITGKTVETLRARYFAMVEIISQYTGDSKNIIHDRFKADKELGTTKDLNVSAWYEIIKMFREYIFEKLEIVI